MDDMWTTVATERRALASDVADLEDSQWATPSWCAGWTVEDVLAHLTATASMTPPTFFARFAGSGFSFPRFAERQIARHKGQKPAETLAGFREIETSTSAPPGPKLSWLGEVIVHSEDIRRPLGIEHTHPIGAVTSMLDFYKGSNTLIGAKSRIAGLTLRATDADWSHGEGPVVEGRAIDLLLAATGRRPALDTLSGDGLTLLASRWG